MTERGLRYLFTTLLIFPFIAFLDVVARPFLPGSNDLREIFYSLFSIPIVLLFYCAWFQPQVIREMFGPFPSESPIEEKIQAVVSSHRKGMVFLGLGLGVFMICCGQFFVGLTVAQKFELLPMSPTPTIDFEIARIVVAATNQARRSIPARTPTPEEGVPANETGLTETPILPENNPTAEPGLTETPQIPPDSGMYAMGEQGEVNGIGVTVLDFFTTDSIVTSSAAAGNTYLVIEVSIQNISREAELPYDPTDFFVQDADGIEYLASPISMNPSLADGTLPTGETAQGYITFEVPSTAAGFILTYNPVDLLDGNPPIQFDLGQ